MCVPQELTSDPQLFVGGASRLDIKQGQLGERRSACTSSMRPSVPSFDHSCGVRRVCCWAPCGRKISIDRCGAGRPPAAEPQHGAQLQQMRAVYDVYSWRINWTQTCYIGSWRDLQRRSLFFERFYPFPIFRPIPQMYEMSNFIHHLVKKTKQCVQQVIARRDDTPADLGGSTSARRRIRSPHSSGGLRA